MKLLGKDIPARALVQRIEDRLRTKGLIAEPDRSQEVVEEGVEARVDPHLFNLSALEAHADPTRPLPLHTHRGGLGQWVLAAKWVYRKSCQVLINETLGRQRLFNGHVLDAYAQLAAELERVKEEVRTLKGKKSAPKKVRAVRKPRSPRSSS